MTKPKWEYLSTPIDSDHIQAELDAFGEQGWELITITKDLFGDSYYYFKRPAGVYPLEGEITNGRS